MTNNIFTFYKDIVTQPPKKVDNLDHVWKINMICAVLGMICSLIVLLCMFFSASGTDHYMRNVVMIAFLCLLIISYFLYLMSKSPSFLFYFWIGTLLFVICMTMLYCYCACKEEENSDPTEEFAKIQVQYLETAV